MLVLKRKPLLVPLGALMALLTLLFFAAVPLHASPPERQCFYIVTDLRGSATWESTAGPIVSDGTATYTTFLAGTDPKLGIPATVHHPAFILSDGNGSITMKVNAKSALVTDNNGNQVPGYTTTWTMVSGTGAYASLRGQGDGYGWLDFATRTFPIYLCGGVHFDPAS